MSVHEDDKCGEDFSDLAKHLTSHIQKKHVNDAIGQLERCKEARINAANYHGEMNNSHTYIYKLVDYLQDCIAEIHKTIKFAEVYGGTTTIIYEDSSPKRFILELNVRGGKRVYTIKARGYDYTDFPNKTL